jgi:SNF2 family DNA or RNA helicase
MCLSTEAIRPTVSRCVHCYCFSCIVDLVLREGYHAKCPICRRPVAFNTLIEIDSDDIKIEEAQEANDVSEDTGESRILPLKRDRETYDSSRDAQTTSSICSTSLPLNPLIQQLKETTHVKSTSTDRGMEAESEFIIPELCMEGVPAVAADLCTIPRPHCPLRSRMAGLPSLDPLPLTHFHMWQTNMLRHSARMIAVHQDMERELGEDQTTKFVIFSQYSECLSKLREMLDGSRIAGVVMSCASVLGGMRPVEREENLKRFAERPACNVCLLLLGAASSGLTLTNANVCYLLEPPHSAVDEAQALNRVHRIGQTKSVRCVVFYAKNTIEERLLGVRKAKRMLSELMQSVDTSSTPHIDSRNKPSAFFGLDALGAILGVRVEEQVAHIGTDDDDSDTDLSDFS